MSVESSRAGVNDPEGLAWVVLVYRVPTEPGSKRVAVWRELKRMGALYLQQCVCLLPGRPEILDELERVTAKIAAMEGEYTLLDVPHLRPGDSERMIAAFRELRDKEYAEIVEECETKFVKEIEFEHFRQNYTYGEAEEIRQDLDKIKRWFASVVARDWFGAERRGEVERWIARCEDLLAEFEDAVYRHGGDDGPPMRQPDAVAPHAIDGLRRLPARQPRAASEEGIG